MPKAPILSREAYFFYIRGSGSGARSGAEHGALIRQLDWNTVTTALGLMVEPASLTFENSKIVQEDATDGALTAIRFTDDSSFQSDFGTGGQQVPVDFNA